MLGYDKTEVFTSEDGRYDEMSSEDCKAIDLEVWRINVRRAGENHAMVEVENNLLASGMGIIADEGLYVPHYASFISAHYEALQRNTPQILDSGEKIYTIDQFPPDGSITPANLSKWHPHDSLEFGCSEKDREAAGWEPSTTCHAGRW